MHVSTLVRRALALLTIAVAGAACSDIPTGAAAPGTRTEKFDLGELQVSAARHADEARGRGPGSRDDDIDEATFRVDPRDSRTYAFGRNWIYFPAYSICDPATSGYGLGTWDTPCDPLRRPIQVTARWKHKGGHGYVEFEPQLRFAPSDHLRDWVILAIYDRKPLASEDYRILWRAGGSNWIDEALTDATLRAYVDRRDQTVYRRIKHFSGYMIAAGMLEDGGFYDAY